MNTFKRIIPIPDLPIQYQKDLKKGSDHIKIDLTFSLPHALKRVTQEVLLEKSVNDKSYYTVYSLKTNTTKRIRYKDELPYQTWVCYRLRLITRFGVDIVGKPQMIEV